MGYLLESTLRFRGTHALFGRLEQVGGDETARQNDAAQSEVFKLRRLTIGYYHHISVPGALKYDIGALAIRYAMPSTPAPQDGREPASLMLFIRLKFQ